MYLLSFFIFTVFCVFFMALQSGGGFGGIIAFVDMPSAIFVVLLLVPMMLHAGVFKDLNNAFRLGGKRQAQAEKQELIRAVEAVSFTIKALWTVGIFCAVFGFVLATVRGGASAEVLLLYGAISLIPLSYTTFFVILLLPLKTRLNMQLKTLCEENSNQNINYGGVRFNTVNGVQEEGQEHEDGTSKGTE